MMRKTLLLALLPLTATLVPSSESSTPGEPVAGAAFHCQVPCGIYGDRMRIDMLMEDAATIEKGMKTIQELEAAGGAANQLVRWIMTKDQHAQSIQETVASYWLAQRIKAPKEGDEAALARYHDQLALLHAITVSAMKCKQTTDPLHVQALRDQALVFSETYFSKEDVQHIREHHGAHEPGKGEHR